MGRLHLARAAIRAHLSPGDHAPGHNRDERSRLEDSLRNLSILEKEHRAAVHSGQVRHTDYVTLSTSDHIWIEVSEGVCELLGYSRSELLGRAAREFVASDLLEKTKEAFDCLVRTGLSEGTSAVIREDGKRIDFEFRARILPDGSIINYWYPQRDGHG